MRWSGPTVRACWGADQRTGRHGPAAARPPIANPTAVTGPVFTFKTPYGLSLAHNEALTACFLKARCVWIDMSGARSHGRVWIPRIETVRRPTCRCRQAVARQDSALGR